MSQESNNSEDQMSHVEQMGTLEPYSWSAIENLIRRATTIRPEQPTASLTHTIEDSVAKGEPNVRPLGAFSAEDFPRRGADALIKENYPYFSYHTQKDPSRYIAHPMRCGKFLLDNVDGARALNLAEAIIDRAHTLPNSGLAWYYPRHYRLSRMLGTKLKYSAISQGTMLAGFAGLAKRYPDRGLNIAKQVFLALAWPFQYGGVNLNDVAVLEMPSFAGPPEIILNGWIDALLHIRDYGKIVSDKEALDLFQRNVAFLAKILPCFDCREARISRYSDLSPYRAKVTLAKPQDVSSLRLLYIPRLQELTPILVPLASRERNGDEFSIYENHIFSQNGRSAHVWLSCSQLYDTVLISDSRSMEVSLHAGVIDRKKATPGHLGEMVRKRSVSSDHPAFIAFRPDRDDLICGYPTNFAKDGRENFYHSYHVVSLLLLAIGDYVSDEQRRVMARWALEWLDDMTSIQLQEGLVFRDTQQMLGSINGGKIDVTFTDFAELLEAASSFVGVRQGNPPVFSGARS